MTKPLDPISYLRCPKVDVADAITLARMMLLRMPKVTSPAARKAAALMEASLDDLQEKWKQQASTAERQDVRVLARRLGAAWKSVRERLAIFELLPEGNVDRKRAAFVRNMLFPEGLDFTMMAFTRQHAQSQTRLEMIEEQGFEKDLHRMVGDDFVEALHAAHESFGDALGVTKKSQRPVAIVLTEPLRKLADAITIYALQMLALAYHDPDKWESVTDALSPIDEFRAAANRRITSGEDEVDEDEEEGETDAVDDIVAEPVVTPPVVTTPPVIALAPVA
jgi:hypothetical protein